jgi:hypothetical protein
MFLFSFVVAAFRYLAKSPVAIRPAQFSRTRLHEPFTRFSSIRRRLLQRKCENLSIFLPLRISAHFYPIPVTMKRWLGYFCRAVPFWLFLLHASGQTNVLTLASDGAWTWFNDPRAIFRNGFLYFGYVRDSDGRVVLSAFNPTNHTRTDLWTSELTQKDDHDNPGLLPMQDGRMLAIYSRHGSDEFFSYRLSGANPASASDWGDETSVRTGARVTYSNPFQLSAEGGRIYNFMRDLNFNPTVIVSTNRAQSWSEPRLFIKTGAGNIRPYVNYCSNYTNRIDFLYTDGHPRDVTNSLYHAYYEAGVIHTSAGLPIKNFSELPLLHDAGQRGSVIYQYSDAPGTDPNDHIPAGRAWCWEIAYQTNRFPVCVFSVSRRHAAGGDWSEDRIFYFYARWTGTNWQKRFIAQAGRPLYGSENDYAGGICIDSEDANPVYISSNAADPFKTADTTDVPLRLHHRYEIWKGSTSDGGRTFAWQPITANSPTDNLRPYVPRNHGAHPALIWFRGVYRTYTSHDCEIVGMFPSAK